MAKKLFPDVTIINPAKQDVTRTIMQATDDLGVDAAVEVSGSHEAATQGLKILKHGGRLSLVGIAKGPVEFDTHPDIIRKETRVFGVLSHILWNTWWQVRTLIETGTFDPVSVITHRFPVSDFDKAFEVADSGKAGKVLLTF